jgi:hypothetical protein
MWMLGPIDVHREQDQVYMLKPINQVVLLHNPGNLSDISLGSQSALDIYVHRKDIATELLILIE